MKSLMVRLPDRVLEWIREKAAMETIRQKKQVSMNSLVVEILEREVEADRKEG
jgi:predicted HicB family RNase H-like nuclease